jgi:hypothetical protein
VIIQTTGSTPTRSPCARSTDPIGAIVQIVDRTGQQRADRQSRRMVVGAVRRAQSWGSDPAARDVATQPTSSCFWHRLIRMMGN